MKHYEEKPKNQYLDKKELRKLLRWHTLTCLMALFMLSFFVLSSTPIMRSVSSTLLMAAVYLPVAIIMGAILAFGILWLMVSFSAYAVAEYAKPSQAYLYQLLASIAFTFSPAIILALIIFVF